MVYMPLVRPMLDLDIKRLEVEFAHGYRAGINVLYIFVCNERKDTAKMMDKGLDN